MSATPPESGRRGALLADIGATHARFALLAEGTMSPIAVLSTADYRSPEPAIAAFLTAAKTAPAKAVLAAAGPLRDEAIALTNCAWRLDARALAERFGFARVTLLNDFAALAWAIPAFRPADLVPVGKGRPRRDAPAVVVGPGTGLGVAAYLPGPDGGQVVSGEGGHVTLPASDELEERIISRLRRRYGHVSAERVLCGPGLQTLYRAVREVAGEEGPLPAPAEITAAALAGSDPASRTTLELFCAFLGTICGDLALTFGAEGGVYVAGGIAPQIVDFLARSPFRARFEAKGRFAAYLAGIPTSVVVREEAAFLGLSRLAAE